MAFVAAWRRMTVYVVSDANGRLHWRYSLRPHIDAAWWRERGARHMIPLQPPVPALWAEFACRTAAAINEKTRVSTFVNERTSQGSNRPLNGGTSSARGLLPFRSPLLSFFSRRRGITAPHRFGGRRRGLLRNSAHLLTYGAVDVPPDDVTRIMVCVAGMNRALRVAGYDVTVQIGESISLQTQTDDPGSVPSFTAPSAADIEVVAAAMAGRLLSIREIERFVEREQAAVRGSVAECLSWLALAGDVETMPGVRREPLGLLRCGRCGETERLRAWDCAVCGEEQCWTCEACRSMGQIRACTVLYAGPAAMNVAAPTNVPALTTTATVRPDGSVPTYTAVSMSGAVGMIDARQFHEADPRSVAGVVVGGNQLRSITIRAPVLTNAQQRASDALEAFVNGCTHQAASHGSGDGCRDAVVWAVCGAGKTEMSFAAVGSVLSRGGRVLFAIPRRDVVREMGQRLRTAFPAVELQVLHGGHDRTVLPVLGPGTMTVATTHQVLRYYRAFDLVILDEVDAFPYRGSRMLADAVARATVPDGWRIRMTATPDRELLRRASRGESVLVRVPVRHHGHPLPVPELVIDKSLDSVGQPDDGGRQRPFRPSRLLLSLIDRTLTGADAARVLVFVPTVALAERVGAGLEKHLGGSERGGVLWSHARDGQRQEKLSAFLDGTARIFVATSILERGITVPDVDVIVLYSDAERIFQEPALIQMAGRVGRTVARPTGHAAFVGRRITRSMRTAVAHIESMNEEAAALGLLRGGRHSGARARDGAAEVVTTR